MIGAPFGGADAGEIAVLDESLTARLHYVRVSDPRIDLARFPDFFIAGPQRTGTTWLHANLREHPEVFLAEPKELFFFSRLKTPGHPRFQSAELQWYLGFFREPAWHWLLKQGFCLARYRRPYRPLVRGEATASYAALDRDVIEEIALLNPRLKVVLMTRDPVARAWSHAMKDLVRNPGRPFDEVREEEFERFFRDPYQLRCARYREQIENWRSCLGAEQVLVGRFDDIARRPIEFMQEVCEFLGVSSDRRFLGRRVEEAVNPSASRPIPPRLRARLEEILADAIASFEKDFGAS